jgi:GNAT superfamily N-acetyltransferase
MNDFNVELATPDMADEIASILELAKDDGYIFELEPDCVHEFITRILNKEYGIIGVINGPEQIEGIIGLNLDRFWFSKQWFLTDAFTFVHPNFRKSTRAKCLLSFAKKCAEEMKVPLVMGVTSNIRTEAKLRLYERQLSRAGTFFVHNSESARVGV